MKITDLLRANLGKLAVPGKGGVINIPRAGSKDGKPSIGVYDAETASGQPGWRYQNFGSMPTNEIDDWIAECGGVDNPYAKRSQTTVKTKERISSLLARMEAGEFAETIGGGGPSVRLPDAVDGVAYVVCDAAGHEIVREVRTKDGKKYLNHRGSDGHWWSGLGESQHDDLLYNHELLAKSGIETPVYICEGPKDAKTMADMGLLSISQLAGSKAKWNPEWNELLRGRWIFIMQDNDKAGEDRTEYLRGELKTAGRMFVVTFENMAEGADVTDWVQENKATSDELKKYIRGVKQPLPRKRDFSKMLSSLSAPEENEEVEEVEDAPALMDKEPATRSALLAWEAFKDVKRAPTPRWLVEGFIAPNETITVFGLPKSNKSTIVLDGMMHAADGRDWFGRRVRKPVLCIFIAAERAETTRTRILAFKEYHGIPADTDLPLVVIDARPDMTSEKDRTALTATIRAIEAHYGMDAGWITIDTLTQTFGGGNQNESQAMANYGVACVAWRKEVGTTNLTIIHHEKKADGTGETNGPKGAIDFLGIIEGAFRVKAIGDAESRLRELSCFAHNNVAPGKLIDFSFKPVKIAEQEDEDGGDPVQIFDIVAIEADPSQRPEVRASSRKKRETPEMRLFIETVASVAGTCSENMDGTFSYEAKRSAIDLKFKDHEAIRAKGSKNFTRTYGAIKSALIENRQLNEDYGQDLYRITLGHPLNSSSF